MSKKNKDREILVSFYDPMLRCLCACYADSEGNQVTDLRLFSTKEDLKAAFPDSLE